MTVPAILVLICAAILLMLIATLLGWGGRMRRALLFAYAAFFVVGLAFGFSLWPRP